MGGNQSSLIRQDSDASERDDCLPCFFLKAPFKASDDPIGSPMPDTPLDQRRKKTAVKNALRHEHRNNPIFSSKYNGLEKEVISQEEKLNQAEIHEGAVRSLCLLVRSSCSIIVPHFVSQRMPRLCYITNIN